MPSRSSINLFVGGINKSVVVVLNLLFMFILKVNSYSLTKKQIWLLWPLFYKWGKNSTSPRVCVCVCVCVCARAHALSCSVMSSSLWPHGLQSASFLCPWDFQGKSTGVGCQFLLQWIFPARMEPKSPASPAVGENGRWRTWTQIFSLSRGF